MKKFTFRIRIFSNSTKPTNLTKKLGWTYWLRHLLWLSAAVAGFLLFMQDPLQIWKTWTDPRLTNLQKVNRNLESELQGAQRRISHAKYQLVEAQELHNKLLEMGGSRQTPARPALPARKRNAKELFQRIDSTLHWMQVFTQWYENDGVNPRDQFPLLRPMRTHAFVSRTFEFYECPFTSTRKHHRGVDFVSFTGDTVFAPGAGIATESFDHVGFGLSFFIDHGNQVRTFYAHLSRVLVRPGTRVRPGQPIALIGTTGRTTGPHLHYEIRINGISINPEEIFL
jgi:murein DD-endopeptidase MepM/ murein hydrolase activator NlpD